MKLRRGFLLLALTLALACGESTTTDPDGGSAELDGGAPTSDGGGAETDGGSVTGVDAGTSMDDAGTMPRDGGISTFDASVEGDPLESLVADGTWQWFDVGLCCRNGSNTGIGVRARPGASRLVIYLQGGGACFNTLTCIGNPASYAGPFDSSRGIFSDAESNPVGDANFIFVPYCTGDVFGGTREGVSLGGSQDFVGRFNMQLVTNIARGHFGEAERVLLTGSSAGGFGAAISYPVVADGFAPTVVDLVLDASPVMADDDVLPPCLQQQWRELWGLVMPEGCTDCTQENGDGMENAASYYASAYPDARFGLISRTGDSTIRSFYSFGSNDCSPSLGRGVGVEEYTAGLLDLRSSILEPTGRWATYFSRGSAHTYFTSGDYTTAHVAGTTPEEWLTDVLAGTFEQVGP